MEWETTGPLWDDASKEFAQGAKGEFYVFHNSDGVRLESVWKRIEYQELLKNQNVTKINYNIVMPDGSIVPVK